MDDFLIQAPNTQYDAPAVIAYDCQVTYAQFINTVHKTADTLRKNYHLSADDRVALWDINSIEYIVTYFSLLTIGSVPCMLSPRNPAEVVQKQCADLKAKFLISSKLPDVDTLETISFHEIIDEYKTDVNSETKSISIPLDNTASVIYTSGSTGDPKAAVHSVGNHFYSAGASNDNLPFSIGDKWLLSLPLYHVSGLSILYRALLAQAAIVLDNPGQTLNTDIVQNQITHVSLVPAQLKRLVEEDRLMQKPQSLKAVLVGGDKPSPKLLTRALEQNLPVSLTYGLTEMSSQVATSKLESLENEKPVTVKILNHAEVQISDEKEILVRGKTLFKGYWADGAIDPATDSEGWFHTGDCGFIDNAGRLGVSGRKDNMFISGGENIYPEEIEAALLAIEGIEQAVVIAVEDAQFGQRPVAFIKIREDAPLKKDDITAQLGAKLADFKIPKQFYRWPKSFENSLKIQHLELRNMFLNRNDDLEEIA